ncbi:MAG: GNAT family N-acetyltransferase [Pseudomonadales bacterium]|nr:GNAT family N-acetyltransferase [Pseudomonadales bacterium]
MRIRTLEADEGMLLKRLRLGSLKESPDSFSPTFEENAVHDDEYWRRAARRIADTPGFEIFVVEIDGHEAGLVSGQVDEQGTGHIGAMWVDPVARGKGVGRALLERVMTFLKDQDCAAIELSVTETNHGAIALYESLGFRFNGNDEPLRHGSPLLNRHMSLEI